MAGEIPKNIRASLYIDGKPAETSLKGVEQVTRSLERELKGLTIGTDAWNKKMQEVAANKKYLKEVKDEINGVGGAFNQLKQELGKVGTLAAGYLGFQFITSQFQGIIAGNAKLSDSLSDIRRVTGLTEAAVLNLDSSLGKLDTRTSKSGLREIAVIAGKLGVAKNQILGFVEATDKLTVALGDELGDADKITETLGKILNVFDGSVNGDNISRLGNAMVKLANDGVASADFISDFTQRVSGIAKTAGLSLPATLAFGAGIEELGGRSESAATAMQKLLMSISSDTPKAAKIAGVSLKDFTKLLGDAPEQALLKYTRGLVANKTAFSDVTKSLDDAGEEGARTIETITKLGQNTDFFTGKITDATKAIGGYNEINEAFALKNENFGAIVDKAGKDFNSLSQNTTLINFLTQVVVGFSELTKWLKNNSEAIATVIKSVVVVTAAWGGYRAATILASTSTSLISAAMATARVASLLLALAQAKLTGDTARAAAASRLLGISMAATPFGVIIALVAALSAAYVLFGKEMTTAAQIQSNLNNVRDAAQQKMVDEKLAISDLLKGLQSENISREDKLKIVNKLRNMMPDYLKQYTDEEILAGKAVGAINKYIQALEKKSLAEAAQDRIKELQKENIALANADGTKADGFWGGVNETFQSVYDAVGLTSQSARLRKNVTDGNKMKITANTSSIKEIQALYGNDIVANAIDDGTSASAITKNVKSLDALKAKLEEVTKARAAAEVGGKDFIRLTAEMKNLQKEIDKYAPSGKSATQAESAQKKALSEFEKLGQEYKALNLQRLNDQLSANQKELKQEGDKYDALIAKEQDFLKLKGATLEQKKTTQAKIKDITADKEKAVNDLRVRQEAEMTQAIADLRIKLSDLHETELQKQSDQINKFYDEQERKVAGNESAIATLKFERAKELTNAELREKERLEKEKAAIEADYDTLSGTKPENRLAKVNKQYDDELIALKKKFSKQLQATQAFQDAVAAIEKNRAAAVANLEVEKKSKTNEAIIAGTKVTSDTTFSMMERNRNSETDSVIRSLEAQRAAELDNKKLTDAQKDEINKRYDEKVKAEKRKAFEAQKIADIAQATINGLLAMTKVSAQTGILSFAFSPLVAIQTAAQIALIASQPTPAYAEGGFSDEDPAGYVSRATVFNRSASGRKFVAGEAGKEWIAPNWMLENPRYANIIGTLEVARKEKRMFASGGYNSDNSDNSGNSGYNFGRLEALMLEMISSQRQANNKKVINVWSETQEFLDDMHADKLRQSA